MEYGSNMGITNFAWQLPLNGNFDETQNLHTILQVSNDLLTFHTRSHGRFLHGSKQSPG